MISNLIESYLRDYHRRTLPVIAVLDPANTEQGLKAELSEQSLRDNFDISSKSTTPISRKEPLPTNFMMQGHSDD